MTEFKVGDRVRLPYWTEKEFLDVIAVDKGVMFGWWNSGHGEYCADTVNITPEVALIQAPVKRYIVEHRPPRKGDRYLSHTGDVNEVLSDWSQPAPVIVQELS